MLVDVVPLEFTLTTAFCATLTRKPFAPLWSAGLKMEVGKSSFGSGACSAIRSREGQSGPVTHDGSGPVHRLDDDSDIASKRCILRNGENNLIQPHRSRRPAPVSHRRGLNAAYENQRLSSDITERRSRGIGCRPAQASAPQNQSIPGLGGVRVCDDLSLIGPEGRNRSLPVANPVIRVLEENIGNPEGALNDRNRRRTALAVKSDRQCARPDGRV